MHPLHLPSQRVFIIASAAIVVVAVSLLLAFVGVRAFGASNNAAMMSKTAPMQSVSGTVYLAPEKVAVLTVIPSRPKAGINIANSGHTVLEGAVVTAVVGQSIHVDMTWGASDFVWEVDTNYNTHFLTPKGEKAAISDIRVGDSITVTGQLVNGGSKPTLEALYVRK